MKLSVVIPTFNRRNLLEQAIDSVIKQSSSVFEIIIADDASTDSTPEFCANLQNSHLPVKLVIVKSEHNLGAQYARNQGIKVSTGDALLFLDSDDVLAPNGIEVLLQQLDSDQTLDYVYGTVQRVDNNLYPIENLSLIGTKFIDTPSEIAGYHWHTMGAIYRREYIFRKVGFWNEELTGSQDWEFQARVKIAGGKRKFVDQIVGYWRDHSNVRVGTKKFRYDYVQSVIKACVSIRDHAIKFNRSNPELEKRLALKIFVHGISFSSDAYPSERKQALQIALQTSHRNPWLKMFLVFCINSPINLDSLILSFTQYRLSHG